MGVTPLSGSCTYSGRCSIVFVAAADVDLASKEPVEVMRKPARLLSGDGETVVELRVRLGREEQRHSSLVARAARFVRRQQSDKTDGVQPHLRGRRIAVAAGQVG